MNNDAKYNNYKTLYDLLILNFKEREGFFQIYIYYINNKFNLVIKNKDNNEIVYKDSFDIEKNDYDNLVLALNNDFIDNHNISLPYFEPLTNLDANIYYKNNNMLPLDYDISRVHVLRNDKFEIKTYYFNGLNEISYDIQDKAMRKLNNKKEKVYSLKF